MLRSAPIPIAILVVPALLGPVRAAGQAPASPSDAEGNRGTVVLVHGAWGGGWDWKPVDRMLTDRGWEVYRVTLTGQGERVHLLGPDVDLSTHVRDVVNTMLFEELDDVVLVGHSYGGMVVTGVADSIPERLRTVVYLDAFVPLTGESLADIVGGIGDPRAEAIEPSWVDRAAPYPRDVPHPAASLREALHLKGPPAAGVPATYVLTVDPSEEVDDFQSQADRAESLGWPVIVMQGDHNVQRSARPELVRLIEEIARAAPDPRRE